MRTLLQDLRYSVRMCLKTPGFTATAVLVLALGIGANSAMFTLVNALVFRPLAGQADTLVGLFSHDRTKPDSYRAFSYPNYVDVRERNDVFEGLMAHTFAMVGMPAGDTTRRTFVELVSSNYFSTVGVSLAAGRPFTAEEERPGANLPVVIVGYERWTRDPSVLGRTVRVNARDFMVVGVAPQGFTGTMALVSPELWLPLGVFDTVVNDVFKNKGTGLADRTNDSLVLAGRLKSGLTIDAATPRLEMLSRQLEEAFPAENKNQLLSVNPLPRMSTSTQPQSDTGLAIGSAMLMAISAVVLLIACLNLANMLLARGSERRKEIAIRLALGGGRGRIIRQLLTEGMVLAAIGAAGGLVLSYWAMRLLAASLIPLLPLALSFDAAPDIRVLAVTAGVVVVSTVVFGLGPALKLSRLGLVTDLKEVPADLGGAIGRRFGGRNVMIVAQLALSLALLVSGGLFARGALKAATADPGFRFDRELLASVDVSMTGQDETRGRATYRRVLERVRSLPGIEAAGMASMVPFGDIHEGRPVERLGAPPETSAENRSATFMIVGADYFKSLGLPMLRGREFTAEEEQSSTVPRVAIINEPLARRLFPDRDPIGQQIRLSPRGEGPTDRDTDPMTVVGVAPGLRFELFDAEPVPHLYVPYGRNYRAGMHLHVRVAAAAMEGEMLATLRREIRTVDATLPVLTLTTMHRFRDMSLELWAVKAGGRLFTVFGGLALLLAVVGIYGVKAYIVSRRTREIGIRMALGARPSDVLWLVLSESFWLTGVGVAVGLLVALSLGRLLGSLLYQVSPLDPLIFTIAPLVLAVSATLACYIPARRATKIVPLSALRSE